MSTIRLRESCIAILTNLPYLSRLDETNNIYILLTNLWHDLISVFKEATLYRQTKKRCCEVVIKGVVHLHCHLKLMTK